MLIKLGIGWIAEPDDYMRAATPAEYVAEITRLRALLREGLELPKSWEDWFARVRKELDHASHG